VGPAAVHAGGRIERETKGLLIVRVRRSYESKNTPAGVEEALDSHSHTLLLRAAGFARRKKRRHFWRIVAALDVAQEAL
jgi:hypothetical protein